MPANLSGPIPTPIREDQEEQSLYQDSILRKLYGLAEGNRRHPDMAFCSRYIGALAFLANPARADIPWPIFRDALVATFGIEILDGRIERHVINDHYKGKYGDLVETARRQSTESSPVSMPQKTKAFQVTISKS